MSRREIWTIGYEQTIPADFTAALTTAGVEVLADVRALPLSRRPGFSKTPLSGAMAEAGIAYRHFKPLGTPADGRAAARKGNDAELARIYAGQLELPEAMAAMAELRALAEERRVALLCYERSPDHCHRQLLVRELFGDFTVTDLFP
ncbi:DUF488 domain-containing protein [Qipengyuania sp. YIM B01966]|uniref:DUF488 domain-containing protein n=1 Tax=Qipengyuania sp. YIM B01966 TaxID=2778646 RepID=UPI0018F53B54